MTAPEPQRIDLLMDLENSSARGWSHVLSLTDDRDALDAFRRRIGSPPSALQLRSRRLHLDVCRKPRQRALALDGSVYPSLNANVFYPIMRAFRRRHSTACAGGADAR